MARIEYITGKEARDKVLEIFKTVNDLVVPSMGARGRMAVINDAFGQPTLTDDGVTIAKSIANMSGYHKMVAKSIIEAAHNTEKIAFDGTTLTVLLTYEIYKLGCEMIDIGTHPQEVSERLNDLWEQVLIDIEKMELTEAQVKDIAVISTKIPALGEAVLAAYKKAGKGMEIVVEYKPNNPDKITLVHTKGMSLLSGYGVPQLEPREGINLAIGSAPKARLALLKDGDMNKNQILKFFGGVTDLSTPIVYVVGAGFNPAASQIIIETHQNAGIPFQFLFLEEPLANEIYLDLAAISNGKIQDFRGGIKEYTYDMCGYVKDINIEIDKSSMVGITEGKHRVTYYEEKVKDKDRRLSDMETFLYNYRLACLKNGLVKMQIGAATQFEYQTIKLKLTDAIGAVRISFDKGVVLGGGKAMYNLANLAKYALIKDILLEPHKRIISNAGSKEKVYRTKRDGVDVVTGHKVDLLDAGIIDSFASLEESIKNAKSIATNYIKAYALIKEVD